MKYLSAIQETAYLTTANTPQYRRIMRIFFKEYEKMHFQLYKEDVLDVMQSYPEFNEYTMEQLKLDLENLVNWKNLVPIQDPKRVYTIADYKNKQFRYSMSEYAVEIERLTIKLENLFMESGNLSTNLFSRIHDALIEAEIIRTKKLKEINEWWHNLQEDFKRLNQNYQDYLREFYSGRADKVLKSIEFIQHKDLFISYLNDFIKDLQYNSTRIEAAIKKVQPMIEQIVLEQVIKSELEIPHPNMEKQESLEENIRDNVIGKWLALKQWFLSEGNRPSECSQVMEITDEVIRKVIQNAALIVQLQNWGISRKDDYKKFISLYLNCLDLKEAHKLAAHVFGIQNVKHYKVNGERSTDSIYNSTYEEDAMEYELKPHTRNYRPKVDKEGFRDKTMEKLEQRSLYLKQVEEERNMVMKYIKDNRLDLSLISDTITESTRLTLLRWISAANTTTNQMGRTEYGQEYELERRNELCTLHCEDGDLKMPLYIFKFKETKHE